MDVFYIPSVMAHAMNGILLLVALIITVQNFSKVRGLDIYRILVLVLLFTIAISVHGISHLGLEKAYDFNPVKWFS